MSIGEFARRSHLSPKALRLYDGLDLLSPARVDAQSGYRYYESAQLDQARLIAALRHIGVPLAVVKEWLALDRAEVAERVTVFWHETATTHAARGDLVTALVDRLTGRSTVMSHVHTVEMPQRSLLCLKRNVDEAGAWALGKEFIGIVRDPRFPRMEGREGAMFAIFWGQVSADSDGPMEMCKRVPDADAEALAEQFPELTLRVEPAHREAYVDLGQAGLEGIDAARLSLAGQELRTWAQEQGIDDGQLALKPEDLGVRIIYMASAAHNRADGPDCDFAVAFA